TGCNDARLVIEMPRVDEGVLHHFDCAKAHDGPAFDAIHDLPCRSTIARAIERIRVRDSREIAGSDVARKAVVCIDEWDASKEGAGLVDLLSPCGAAVDSLEDLSRAVAIPANVGADEEDVVLLAGITFGGENLPRGVGTRQGVASSWGWRGLLRKGKGDKEQC